MNVIIRNDKTGHQQTITKEAWERGKKWFVGYRLLGDDPKLLPPNPEKKIENPVIKEPLLKMPMIKEPEKTIESLFEPNEPKQKRKRKKKPENGND
jgi:hypothetical protein